MLIIENVYKISVCVLKYCGVRSLFTLFQQPLCGHKLDHNFIFLYGGLISIIYCYCVWIKWKRIQY